MLYQNKIYVHGLYFTDIFPDAETFESKVDNIDGLTNMDELYEVLFNKYFRSETRYTSEAGFIHSLKFKLQVIWPAYVIQKGLLKEIQELTLQEIVDGDLSIINQANNPNIPTVDPVTKPIPNLSSTQQTSLRKLNKLEALRLKYEASMNDYLSKIYNALDGLFVQILTNDTKTIYPQGV